MADVVAERVAEQKAVLNGEAEDREEPDPVEEAGKKKKKKKKKSKSATAGELVLFRFFARRLVELMLTC